MQRDDLAYVRHILDIGEKVSRILREKSRDEFDQDEVLSYAVTHLIQTIGEAARSISGEFRDAHPEIPWRAIVGMRHRIVHDYLDVDLDLVWDVATRDLPSLVADLRRLA